MLCDPHHQSALRCFPMRPDDLHSAIIWSSRTSEYAMEGRVRRDILFSTTKIHTEYVFGMSEPVYRWYLLWTLLSSVPDLPKVFL